MNLMLTFMVVPDWLPWVVGTAALIGVILSISAAFARKRTQALTAVALQIGFNFEGNNWNDPGKGESLKTTLFTKGRSRTFRNIMSGSSGGFPVSVFDYSYVVGYGRSQRTCAQTIATFSKSGLQMPEFAMEPKGLMGKIGDAFTHKNINFESHPEFSRHYQLRGPDQEKTRALFSPGLLSFIENLDRKKNWSLEGSGDTLFIYRASKKTKPEDLRTFLEETTAVASSFVSLSEVKASVS
jgi:hypothetical protein